MGHSIGDGIIVATLAALFFGYLYLNYGTRIKRLDLIHQERLVAMDKDFPLPELPLDPPAVRAPLNRDVLLIVGIVLLMFGGGTMFALAFALTAESLRYWVMPLPVALIGVGLIFAHRLTRPRGV